jgi:hypothetical protein
MIIPIANSFNVFFNIRQGKTYSESDLRDICASVLRGKFSSFTQIITGYIHKIHLMKTVGVLLLEFESFTIQSGKLI